MFPSKAIIDRLRQEYPVGTRVALVSMDDPQAPPVGTKGTVLAVDDMGSLLMRWDNGCGLNVAYGCDKVRKLDPVTVVCYGQTEEWEDRKDATDFYFEGMNSCEGSEQSRYASIYADLILGKKVCTDEEDE